MGEGGGATREGRGKDLPLALEKARKTAMGEQRQTGFSGGGEARDTAACQRKGGC